MHDKPRRGARAKRVVRAVHGRRVWARAGPPKIYRRIRVPKNVRVSPQTTLWKVNRFCSI